MTYSAIVIGAGDATGGAVAKHIAGEGMPVCAVRRTKKGLAEFTQTIKNNNGVILPIGADARKEDDMVSVFDKAEHELGPVDLVVFNIGANVRFPFADIEIRKFTKIWEMACFAGFLTMREAARRMIPRKRGTIIVTGASASIKGYPGGAAFASAKFALRGMAQAAARELGPQGIHIAHSIIDGAIDTAFIRDNFPEMYNRKDSDGILNPEHIASTYWQIYQQPRDAWTHEIDLRPWSEQF